VPVIICGANTNIARVGNSTEEMEHGYTPEAGFNEKQEGGDES
jgi:hypothetical protein